LGNELDRLVHVDGAMCSAIVEIQRWQALTSGDAFLTIPLMIGQHHLTGE
jgi:hypothetical protein